MPVFCIEEGFTSLEVSEDHYFDMIRWFQSFSEGGFREAYPEWHDLLYDIGGEG